MNKVILMGRLTRDPEVDIRRARVQMQLPDIHWQLTAVSNVTEMQQQILSTVYLSEERQNLQRSICARE